MIEQVVEPGRRHVVAKRLEQYAGVAIGEAHFFAEEVAFDVGPPLLRIERGNRACGFGHLGSFSGGP
jgi:hypothetical protein